MTDKDSPPSAEPARNPVREAMQVVIDMPAEAFLDIDPTLIEELRQHVRAAAPPLTLPAEPTEALLRECQEALRDAPRMTTDERAALWAKIDDCLEASPLRAKYDDVLVPFVALMRQELHANSGKGDRPGWLSMSKQTAILEIWHHAAKLQKAALNDDQAGIQEFAADVANMAMMLVDVCGALAASPPPAASSVHPAVQASGEKPDGAHYDEAVELLRKAFCSLPRFSFLLDGGGNVKRVPDRCGNWIDFQSAHELFDPCVVDELVAKARGAE